MIIVKKYIQSSVQGILSSLKSFMQKTSFKHVGQANLDPSTVDIHRGVSMWCQASSPAGKLIVWPFTCQYREELLWVEISHRMKSFTQLSEILGTHDTQIITVREVNSLLMLEKADGQLSGRLLEFSHTAQQHHAVVSNWISAWPPSIAGVEQACYLQTTRGDLITVYKCPDKQRLATASDHWSTWTEGEADNQP